MKSNLFQLIDKMNVSTGLDTMHEELDTVKFLKIIESIF